MLSNFGLEKKKTVAGHLDGNTSLRAATYTFSGAPFWTTPFIMTWALLWGRDGVVVLDGGVGEAVERWMVAVEDARSVCVNVGEGIVIVGVVVEAEGKGMRWL